MTRHLSRTLSKDHIFRQGTALAAPSMAPKQAGVAARVSGNVQIVLSLFDLVSGASKNFSAQRAGESSTINPLLFPASGEHPGRSSIVARGPVRSTGRERNPETTDETQPLSAS